MDDVEFQGLSVAGSTTLGDLKSSITWGLGEEKEIMKISEGKFYWKGEEVTDAHQVYERFNEWLTQAKKTK